MSDINYFPEFWQCDCADNFMHPTTENRCLRCGAVWSEDFTSGIYQGGWECDWCRKINALSKMECVYCGCRRGQHQ